MSGTATGVGRNRAAGIRKIPRETECWGKESQRGDRSARRQIVPWTDWTRLFGVGCSALLGSELPIGLPVFSERFSNLNLGNFELGGADSPTGLRVEIVDFSWTVSEIWDDKIESIRSIASRVEPMDIVRFI